MIVTVSEVWLHPDRKQDYLALVAELQPALHAIDGFISSERFESCSEPGKYVSVSRWRNEAALRRWRNLEEHRLVMTKGRGGILTDYRIQVTNRPLGLQHEQARGSACGFESAVWLASSEWAGARGECELERNNAVEICVQRVEVVP